LTGFNYACIIAVPIIVAQCSARFMVYTTYCCSAQNTSFSHDGQNRLTSTGKNTSENGGNMSKPAETGENLKARGISPNRKA